MLAVIGLLQRRPGEADHPVAMRQRLDPAVNGLPLLGACANSRDGERVPAHQPLEAVQHPGDVAHAADQLGLGKQRPAAAAAARTRPGWCRRSPPCPPAAGSRPRTARAAGRALRSSSRNTAVSFCGPMAFSSTVDQRRHRPGHRGMEARVLPQDPGQQRRARARQPGDEMQLRQRPRHRRQFPRWRPAGPLVSACHPCASLSYSATLWSAWLI